MLYNQYLPAEIIFKMIIIKKICKNQLMYVEAGLKK